MVGAEEDRGRTHVFTKGMIAEYITKLAEGMMSEMSWVVIVGGEASLWSPSQSMLGLNKK